jgi:hypothetical protein
MPAIIVFPSVVQDILASTRYRPSQNLGYQSHLLGGPSHPEDLSQALDRNGDLSAESLMRSSAE